MARDAHQQALVAMALLEEDIEWLSHSVSYRWSGSCRQSGSHRCRSQSAGHPSQAPWVEPCHGALSGKLNHPVQLEWDGRLPLRNHPQKVAQRGTQQWRSFHHQSQQQRTHLTGAQEVEADLMCPPSLDPLQEDFLGGEAPQLGIEGGDVFWWSSMPEPSLENSSEWVAWWANLVDTWTWWPELSMVPRERDVEEFARKVWASFELPKRRSHAQGTPSDYSAPPAPQALECDWFLTISNITFGGQDYDMWQLQKTLAYAKALQYWAEKAQLPCPGKPCWLAESVWELHQVMEPLATFTDMEVLENNLPSN